MKQSKLSIAYGSNLNIDMMRKRCPTAHIVCQGEIQNYEMIFRGRPGRVTPTSIMATIEPCPGENLPVLVWEIQPSDEAALDIYEEYPVFYRKEQISVVCGSQTIDAMAYVMTDGYALGIPSDFYINAVKEGYSSAGFDINIIDDALEYTKELMSKQ